MRKMKLHFYFLRFSPALNLNRVQRNKKKKHTQMLFFSVYINQILCGCSFRSFFFFFFSVQFRPREILNRYITLVLHINYIYSRHTGVSFPFSFASQLINIINERRPLRNVILLLFFLMLE
jgi:hypothetical protein